MLWPVMICGSAMFADWQGDRVDSALALECCSESVLGVHDSPECREPFSASWTGRESIPS